MICVKGWLYPPPPSWQDPRGTGPIIIEWLDPLLIIGPLDSSLEGIAPVWLTCKAAHSDVSIDLAIFQ